MSVQPPDQYIARPLAKRDEDERLLAARLVTSRRPGQWVGAAVLLVLFAMLVHTVVTNGRFQWNVVGDYFVSRSIMDGLVLTLWLTAAVRTCGFVLGSASSPGTSSSSSASSDPGTAAPSAASTVIPTQDVVSGIAEDPKLNAELPASVRSSGQLILGTTISPGISGLPHVGQAFLGASSVSASSISTITDACGYLIATAPGSTFQTLLTTNASKCAATGKKPWTVQYFSDSAPIFLGLANGKVDLYFGPTLSLKYDATHIAGTKFLGQISSTPVGFVTAKGSAIAKALSTAVNELITNGDYAKIFAKWGISGDEITSSTINPATTF